MRVYNGFTVGMYIAVGVKAQNQTPNRINQSKVELCSPDVPLSPKP